MPEQNCPGILLAKWIIQRRRQLLLLHPRLLPARPAALDDRIGHGHEQSSFTAPDGIVAARDDIVDFIGVALQVHNGDKPMP